MIVPTVVITYPGGEIDIYNLSQFVKCEGDDAMAFVTFADGSKETFVGDHAKQIRGSIRYLHNTYQATVKAYEEAKSQLVTPAPGRIIQ